MSQKSITSFFKPMAARNMKRSRASGSTQAKQDSQESKKPKLDSHEENCDKTELNKDIQDAIAMQCAVTPLLHPSIGETWFTALQEQFQAPYFRTLSEYVNGERKKGPVHPSAADVFSWSNQCTLQQVKVVILGQDPYHGLGQAHGLCFSVLPGVRPPPSLKNMFKELNSDIEDFEVPTHGHLVGWAQQGVLLLNAVLTVRQHNANSHRGRGWERFTDAVIKSVSSANTGVVFLLWGKDAHNRMVSIQNKEQHHILKSVHPSPLSASRGFLGCKHFSKCNELLSAQDKEPIDWTRLPL